MPQIVRFQDLEPTWSTRRALQPGFRRWLVTWVGGPEGCINTNPGVAIPSQHCAIGLMVLPRGQRQAGLHVHGVSEIYVVLEGTLEGLDASEHSHGAGVLDCTVTPPGCPHGVKNSGGDDVKLVWVHDGIERNDAAVYYEDDHAFGDVPGMGLVRYADLEPGRPAVEPDHPGAMPWSVTWVGGLSGSPARVTTGTVHSDRLSIGLTVLEPGQRTLPSRMPVARFWLVTDGEVVLETQSSSEMLGYLDGALVAAGEETLLRNGGDRALHLLWVDSPSA